MKFLKKLKYLFNKFFSPSIKYQQETEIINKDFIINRYKQEIKSKSILEYNRLVDAEKQILRPDEMIEKAKRVRERELKKLNDYLSKKGQI